MARYRVQVPRWIGDIVRRRRTLLHLPVAVEVPEIRPGDQLALTPPYDEENPDCMLIVTTDVVEVSKVRLADILADHGDDWGRLNLGHLSHVEARFRYSQRWDAANPEVPWETNPLVWRVVFRYITQGMTVA